MVNFLPLTEPNRTNNLGQVSFPAVRRRLVTESTAAAVMYMAPSILWNVHNFSCHILWLVPYTLLVFKFVIWHLHYTCKWVEFITSCNKNSIPRPKPKQFLLYSYGAKIKQQWGWNITPLHLCRATYITALCITWRLFKNIRNWHILGNDFSCPVVVWQI